MKAIRLNAGTVFTMLKKSFSEWSDDNAMRLSAALSYYSVFSIAPLLLIAIGIAGWFFKGDAAQGQVSVQLGSIVGWEAAAAIEALVKSASKSSGGATIIGFVTLLIGASTVFGQLKESLNTIWGVKQKSGLGISGMIKERVMTFGMVLVIGFLLLISLLLTTVLAAMNGWMESYLHLPKFVSAVLGFVVPLVVEVLLFGLLFKLLPDVKIPWNNVWMGAVVTAVLFEIGKGGLAWYLGRPGTTSAFGAGGSIVLLLLWVYYASCILFFGAEFTKVYSKETGVRVEPSEVAEAATAKECSVPGAAAPVAVQVNPLTPHASVAPVPMKESLGPLLVTPHLEHDVLRETRLAKPWPRPEPKTRWESWIETAHQYPAAEFGAALGLGLLAGTLSRMVQRSAPELSATDHFRVGGEKAAKAGNSLLVAAASWVAHRVTRKALRSYGKEARKQASHFADAASKRVDAVLS